MLTELKKIDTVEIDVKYLRCCTTRIELYVKKFVAKIWQIQQLDK